MKIYYVLMLLGSPLVAMENAVVLLKTPNFKKAYIKAYSRQFHTKQLEKHFTLNNEDKGFIFAAFEDKDKKLYNDPVDAMFMKLDSKKLLEEKEEAWCNFL